MSISGAFPGCVHFAANTPDRQNGASFAKGKPSRPAGRFRPAGDGGRETGAGSAGGVEPKGVDRLGEAFHGLHDVLGSLLEIAQ